jgi:hypothetical protein
MAISGQMSLPSIALHLKAEAVSWKSHLKSILQMVISGQMSLPSIALHLKAEAVPLVANDI